MHARTRRLILILHGIATCAAAIVLAAFPAAIPATVGITVEPPEYLLSYLLAAAELGIGVLSLGAARLTDQQSIRLIALAFAAFHGGTAVMETVYVATAGASAVLIANVVVRVIGAAVFLLMARGPRPSTQATTGSGFADPVM